MAAWVVAHAEPIVAVSLQLPPLLGAESKPDDGIVHHVQMLPTQLPHDVPLRARAGRGGSGVVEHGGGMAAKRDDAHSRAQLRRGASQRKRQAHAAQQHIDGRQRR